MNCRPVSAPWLFSPLKISARRGQPPLGCKGHLSSRVNAAAKTSASTPFEGRLSSIFIPCWCFRAACVAPLLVMASVRIFSQDVPFPKVDRRAAEIRNLDTPCSFQPPKTKEEWLGRAKYVRRQILMSAGLWPSPEKTPLNSQIFGKIERKEYSIEK